jgi:flagellin-like protein
MSGRRSAVSPVIATLLLIAIAVAAAIIVYAFVTGLIGGLTGGGGSNLVTVSGNIIVPTGSTSGSLVLNIKNSANSPIIAVFTPMPQACAGCASSEFTYAAGAGGMCLGTGCTTVFTFNGAAVSAANPLPVGSETSAAVNILQTGGGGILLSGSTYSFPITVTFASGSPQTQIVSITTQL